MLTKLKFLLKKLKKIESKFELKKYQQKHPPPYTIFSSRLKISPIIHGGVCCVQNGNYGVFHTIIVNFTVNKFTAFNHCSAQWARMYHINYYLAALGTFFRVRKVPNSCFQKKVRKSANSAIIFVIQRLILSSSNIFCSYSGRFVWLYAECLHRCCFWVRRLRSCWSTFGPGEILLSESISLVSLISK